MHLSHPHFLGPPSWVGAMRLMRRGSAQICLMTRKADSWILTALVAQRCTCFVLFFHPPSLQQELPTEPRVDAKTPRLISQPGLLVPLPETQDLSVSPQRRGMWNSMLLLKSGVLTEQGQPVHWGEELLVCFSSGCQKRKGKKKKRNQLFAYLAGIWAENLYFPLPPPPLRG